MNKLFAILLALLFIIAPTVSHSFNPSFRDTWQRIRKVEKGQVAYIKFEFPKTEAGLSIKGIIVSLAKFYNVYPFVGDDEKKIYITLIGRREMALEFLKALKGLL